MSHFELSPDQHNQIEGLHTEKISQPVISLEELNDLVKGNEDLEELLDQMLKSCLEYTISIAKFKEILSRDKGEISEDMQAIDNARKRIHDVTISDVNIFSRMLQKNAKNNSWMSTAGMDGLNRAAYGRFALTLTLSRL